MIVTFVSQCEKKSLKRTRQVLDAFANRIGDNTWQTTITEEGLQAVKRLLRQTASKNTAVSCHSIRSRVRSDLLWVVGRRSAFNYNGLVPVNYTSKEIIMDELPIETKHILANTKGQPLSQHLFAVGYLAYCLIEKMGIKHDNLARACFIAGLLHDIGKLDSQFQQWLSKKLGKQANFVKDELPLPNDGFHIDSSVTGYSKFSFEKYPRHHEISWLFALALLQDANDLNPNQLEQIYHGIYWHHTRPYRKNEDYFGKSEGIFKLLKKSLTSTTIDKLFEELRAVLKETKSFADYFANVDRLKRLFPRWTDRFKLIKTTPPNYKTYSDINDDPEEYHQEIKKNALNSLVRTAVISADRIVSTMSADDLAEYLMEGSLANALDNIMLDESTLANHIKQCLQGFDEAYPNSERNQAQATVASELVNLQEFAKLDETHNIGVLQGPAGCGKTKIALEWALHTHAPKIIWVCPRIQVCLGLLNDLTQLEYLPNAKIEILTGEHKKILRDGISINDTPEMSEDQYFSGDIVITTIDQVIKNIISHTKVTGLVNFMQAHVVFDEFHELIPMPAFNLLFAELVEAKKLCVHQANTLLVSATPHDYFVTKLLKLKPEDIYRIRSFNESLYKIEFKTYDDKEDANPLINTSWTDGTTTFVITNTAQAAQRAFIQHQADENNVLLHSKYTKADKTEWFNRVFKCFKYEGTGEYDVLRSGPIVQASLNISCDRMITELTNAENWLQRLGRLDRFGMNEEVNHYTTVLPHSSENGKQTSSTAKFLNYLCSWRSTIAWLDFLKDRLTETDCVNLNELYKIYREFYDDTISQEKISEDIQKALRESVQLINKKVVDPLSFPPKSKRNSGVVKISATSLRGNNCFVQMAVCKVDKNLHKEFLEEYAYDEDIDHSQVVVGLTESIDKVQGGTFEMRDSNKNLVSFMKQKHHNIMQGKYPDKTFNSIKFDFELLKQARSPEHPIYVSYTPNDLEPIGGQPHPFAIYYVQTDKQPVGSMQRDRLNDPTSED